VRHRKPVLVSCQLHQSILQERESQSIEMDDQVRLLRHIEGLSKKAGNNVCAECPERHPTWASLIKPVVKGGAKIGVFVCQQCYKHHYALGMSICEVKSLSMATECKLEPSGC
jgi:Putative GTPase activating protein for Arf